MKKVAGCLALCLTLSGCFFNEGPYPELGRGGFAEWRPIEDSRAFALQQRLDAAKSRGAEIYQAAAYADATLLLTRCRRELQAGLTIDAEADLNQLESQIVVMDASLARTRAQRRESS